MGGVLPGHDAVDKEGSQERPDGGRGSLGIVDSPPAIDLSDAVEGVEKERGSKRAQHSVRRDDRSRS